MVEAAIELGLVDPASSCERLVVGGALEYPCLETKEIDESTRFHGICIDVFDGANLMPPGFYSVPFLEKLRDNLLKTEGTCGFVIHNFHTSEPSGSSLSWRMLWNLTGMFSSGLSPGLPAT